MKQPLRLLYSFFVLLSFVWRANGQSPVVLTQPESQTVFAGASVTFSVAATGGVSTISFPTVSSGTLKLWLKADAGVITENNRVTEWGDQSTNGNNAFQSDTNKQPVLVSGGDRLNNKPVVRFDGVRSETLGDLMHGNGDLALSNAYTSFLVYSEADPNVYEQLPAVVGEVGYYHALRAYYIYNFNGIPNEMGFASWTYDYGSGFRIPTNQFRIWTLRLNETKSRLEYFDTDGINDFTTNHPTSGMVTPAPGYYVGGAVYGKFYHLKGDIAELIYFQGKLTEEDRRAVENYLRQKYFSRTSGSGTGLTYSWRFNGLPLSGATNCSLTLTNLQAANAGNYSVAVSNLGVSTISSNALLTVIVSPNHAPVAISQLISLNEDASLPIVLAGTDADGDILSYSVTAPVYGSLTGIGPNLVYKPSANYYGTDSFSFKVNDGHVDSAMATVNITVVSVNDAPVALAEAFPAFLFSESDPMTVVIASCDSNAIVILDGSRSYDVENDPIQFSWWEGTNMLASGEVVTNTFEPGTHAITLAVSDGLDTGVGALTLEVITPAQAVAELVEFVEKSALPQKRKQPLMANLNAAIASVSRCQMKAGINQLEGFQMKVMGQILPVYPALATQMLNISHEIIETFTPSKSVKRLQVSKRGHGQANQRE